MYPFGMQMPGRNYNLDKYRFSINGQEKSPEMGPNFTTAEFWQFDARIARRWNIDPVFKEYESPYAVFSNSPIRFIDPDGLDSGDPKYKEMENVTIVAKKPREGTSRTSYEEIHVSMTISPTGNLSSPGSLTLKIPYTERYHRGGKFFPAGWYRDNPNPIDPRATDYELTQIQWDKGQVMTPADWRYYVRLQWGFRDWNGYQVNSDGYLTGEFTPPPPIEIGINPFKISRFLRIFSKLLYSAVSREKILEKIKNSNVRNLVKSMYRKENMGKELIGSGSATDALRWTAMTGKLVGGSDHVIKIMQSLKNAERILRKHVLNDFDRRVILELINDMKNALRGG